MDSQYHRPNTSLIFFLFSLLPSAAIIFLSFYMLQTVWATGILVLVLILVGSFFASVKLNHGGEEKTPAFGTEVSRKELDSILNNFGDALIIYDDHFRILFFNAAAEKLFMVSAVDVVGSVIAPEAINNSSLRIFTQVIFPTLAPVMIPRSQAGVWPQVVDLSFASPQLEFRVSTSRLEQIPGQPARFLKIIKNLTHETALLKTKTDFVTVASHQLKTPLTHINWALETLNDDTTLSTDNKEIVDAALKASNLLTDIVGSLLNISRIEEGRFGYKFETANIADFIDQILNQVSSQASRAGVRIFFDKSTAPTQQVFIDPQRLSLAIMNLLDNAIRYNVKNGEVTVRAAQIPNKPFIELTVKDTGIGISPEELEKLFTKFFRAENAVKFQTEGTGLGLYIAKNIVEAHGGQLTVESELGRGTTFHLTLPTEQSLVPQRELPESI